MKLAVVSTGQPVAAKEVVAPEVPAPEVSERPVRRSFTAAYKVRVLKAADAAKEEGEVGAVPTSLPPIAPARAPPQPELDFDDPANLAFDQ